MCIFYNYKHFLVLKENGQYVLSSYGYGFKKWQPDNCRAA